MSFTFPSTCTVDLSWRGTQYRELLGSASFNYNADSPSTTRKYVVDWINAEALAQALVGTFTSSGGTQQWQAPHRDPARSQLYALSVAGEGIGDVGQRTTPNALGIITGEIIYDMAILTVEYGPLPDGGTDAPGIQNVTFLTERRDGSAQAITLPKKKWLWKEGSKSGEAVGDDATLFVVVPQTVITIDIHWWIGPPPTLGFEDLFGSVNDGRFRILQTSYPKGTLRFDHSSRSRQWTSEGVEAWQISHKFTRSKEEWNKKFDPDEEKWYLVGTKSGKTIHDEVDFTRAGIFPR